MGEGPLWPDGPDAIITLLERAALLRAHVAIHANYSPSSDRFPLADWSAQLVWVSSEGPESVYGVGDDLHDACESCLFQLPGATR